MSEIGDRGCMSHLIMKIQGMSSSSSTKQIGDGKGVISDNNENSSQSAYLIGGNIDILTLILIRLPSKSLLVFKSVSKQFLFIITDPQFIHKHFLQNPKFSIPGVFLGKKIRSSLESMYEYISFDGNADNSSYVHLKTLHSEFENLGFRVLQSCNGLLLFSTRSDRVYTYYVFNPFTNKYKVLPPLSFGSNHYSVSLAFDPFKSPYYKVIAVWRHQYSTIDGYGYRIEMCDHEMSSWRFSGFYSSIQRSIYYESGTFWNGSLYWGNSQGSLFYIDVDRESVGELPPPSCEENFNCPTYYDIAEYGGHLYLIRSNLPCFSIFEMDAANSSWIFIGQVDVSLNPYVRSTILRRRDELIFIIQGGEEKESTKVVLLEKYCKVVSYYDLKDKTYTKICDLSAPHKIMSYQHSYQIIESLACV